MIKEGDMIPDVSLKDQEGKEIRLKDLVGLGWLVVYFYPKDGTSKCTAQACMFRDRYQDFADSGAIVVGISSDKENTHKAFTSHYQLPFTLLSDDKGVARKAFGVPRSLGLIPGRVTYVIGLDGIIRMIFNSQIRATEHVDRALEFIRNDGSKL